MKTIWTQGLSGEDKEDFEKSVRGSKIVLDKLLEICYTKRQSRISTSLKDYESPSWPFKRADQDGYERALTELISIIDLDDKIKG